MHSTLVQIDIWKVLQVLIWYFSILTLSRVRRTFVYYANIACLRNSQKFVWPVSIFLRRHSTKFQTIGAHIVPRHTVRKFVLPSADIDTWRSVHSFIQPVSILTRGAAVLKFTWHLSNWTRGIPYKVSSYTCPYWHLAHYMKFHLTRVHSDRSEIV